MVLKKKKYFSIAFTFLLSISLSLGQAKDLSAQKEIELDSYLEKHSGEGAHSLGDLLAKPLTVDRAIEVFLLNNPGVQTTLQDLKISRADRLQERLLPNPHVEATYHQGRLHDTGENSAHQEYKVSQDLNAILLYPLKWRVSGSKYDEAKMRVAENLQEQIADVKKTFFHLQALQQKQLALTKIMQAIEAATELAKRQRAAGTLNALDLANQETLFHEIQLRLDHTDAQLETSRSKMQETLGLGQSDLAWQVEDELPKIPPTEPDLLLLENLALSKHPKLLASRSGLKALEREETLEYLNIIPSMRGGVLWEKEDDFKSFGPYGQIEIPLTDWNQASIRRARSKKRQAEYQLIALESHTLTNVRTLHKRMMTAKKAAQRYEGSILPLRVSIVQESQKQYNFMLSGVYQLLQAKQNEIAAFQNYIEILEEYWVTRTELEKIIGVTLPLTSTISENYGESK